MIALFSIGAIGATESSASNIVGLTFSVIFIFMWVIGLGGTALYWFLSVSSEPGKSESNKKKKTTK